MSIKLVESRRFQVQRLLVPATQKAAFSTHKNASLFGINTKSPNQPHQVPKK
jgi:hypothetical protein